MVDCCTSAEGIKAAIVGPKLFFEVTPNLSELMGTMKYVSAPHRLPVALMSNEVARLIAATENLKYKAAMLLAYGEGMHVSEVTGLTVGEIDSQHIALGVKPGKGRKDRYTRLSSLMLEYRTSLNSKQPSYIEQRLFNC